MSIEVIARLIESSGHRRGKVTDIRGGQLYVATSEGTVVTPTAEGIAVGDFVNVIGGIATKSEAKQLITYQL